MRNLKYLIYTIGIVLLVGLCLTLLYFLTMFGGVLISVVLIFILVREYHLEGEASPEDPPPDKSKTD